MSNYTLLLALCDATVLAQQCRPRTDEDHRRMYNLMAAAVSRLHQDHPALEEICGYQDDATLAVEARDHRPLVRAGEPHILATERNLNPQQPWSWREVLRRATALETPTTSN